MARAMGIGTGGSAIVCSPRAASVCERTTPSPHELESAYWAPKPATSSDRVAERRPRTSSAANVALAPAAMSPAVTAANVGPTEPIESA